MRALEALEAPRALGRYLVAQRCLGRLQVRLALLVGEQLLLDVLQGACERAAGAHSRMRCGALAAGQGKACARRGRRRWRVGRLRRLGLGIGLGIGLGLGLGLGLRTPAPSRLAFIEAARERESCARCASIDSVLASE